MMSSHIRLPDLPNDILLIIFKKLCNIDLLYSLMGIGSERLDRFLQDPIFTDTLSFVSTDDDETRSIDNSILNRFCVDILPRIHHNVRPLTFQSTNMQRILHAADYPHLTEIQIFDWNQQILAHSFTDESFLRPAHKQFITHLTLSISEKGNMKDYSSNVYPRILSLFKNLKELNVVQPFDMSCPLLSFQDLPSTAFSSSTLIKLRIMVANFDDCLCLLDGRLEQLSNLSICIGDMRNQSSLMNITHDLPHLKYFSFECKSIETGYDTQIVPLLRRMRNLEELSLYLCIYGRNRAVDGTQLHNDILVHMPRLHTFVFYIKARSEVKQPVSYLSVEDLRRSFTNIGYDQVACFVRDDSDSLDCYAFSLPFTFDRLLDIRNVFPNLIYTTVTILSAAAFNPFKHEFFVRISQCFPALKNLFVCNYRSPLKHYFQYEPDDNQTHSTIEYPHIKKLDFRFAHIYYLEQFLDESRTHLPRLVELKVKYKNLREVTENFTRNLTRATCRKVRRLILNEERVHTADFYDYFPLL